jgi:DNA polymerase-1
MPIRIGGRDYLEHTTLDFEFIAKGNVPEVVSLVAYEAVSGKWHRYLGDELRRLKQPPFPVDDHSLVSGFPFMSESDCFRSLGWPQPRNVFCLFSTYRRLTNGLQARGQKANGLIAALTYYGETSIAQNAKESMHELILRGRHTSDELRQILIYNEEDVAANRRLYPHFIPEIDDPSAWSQVLFYGEGAKAWSQLQCAGIPIDDDTLSQLLKYWDLLKLDLIEEVDSKFHVFLDGHFKSELFDKYLRDNIIRWPRLDSGRLRLDDETFRDMAELHPRLMPLHQLRTVLSKMRLTGLTIGSDGRNRFQYWPLSAITCRCGASNRENIFGPSNWMRYLVRPLPGKALSYIDWYNKSF